MQSLSLYKIKLGTNLNFRLENLGIDKLDKISYKSIYIVFSWLNCTLRKCFNQVVRMLGPYAVRMPHVVLDMYAACPMCNRELFVLV